MAKWFSVDEKAEREAYEEVEMFADDHKKFKGRCKFL